jgi:hypothetical protein
MKEYILKFRSQVFEGAFSLFKRVLVPTIILNIIVTVIFFVVLFALMAASGISLMSMAGFNDNIREAAFSGQGNKAMMQMMQGMMGFVLLCFFVFMVVGAWIYYMYLKLNDNEIRENNNSAFAALSRSFSSGIWSVMGYFLLLFGITLGVMLVFGLIAMVFMLMGSAGIAFVFIGYFFVLIFLLRFILGLPAIVHGKMSAIEALNFSYRNVTWKRSAFIFLGVIVVYVIFGIVAMLAFAIIGTPFMSGGTPALGTIAVFMVIFMLLCAALYAFAFSSLSALYFRYSGDALEAEEGDLKEHLLA